MLFADEVILAGNIQIFYMATLYFKIGADYEAVIRLRDEIKKLENQLKSFGKSTPEAEIRKIEERLASIKQQMMGLVTEAAKAGAAMENDLKRKIDSVTKSSDELSSEIIKQRTIIRETQEDVRRLSEQYSKMGKYSPQSTSTLNQLNKAKAALNEQRYALGELQDQQARNRLELRQLTREYRDFSQGTDKATVTVDALMSSLKRTAAEIGGLAAIKKFGSDVINATGTMQQLHVALSTILQDGDKASKLISEITQFAAKTPFNLEDVASGAKQLLAYGSSAETVVDELSMLGDVAAGLQIPIGQLIYLYGTLRTQGRAMTVDIRQFAGRGIPIYEELAKVLGVTKDKVGELVTAGEVGFKEVEQAFKNMTSEGGKFNDLMENSAGTWPQRMSNIQDTLFQKLNDFGNKYREVFEFGIGTTEELVEHLDDVISVIGSLIAAYGTYRAALIAAAVAQKAVGFVESIRLIMAYRKQLGLATAAQQAFNLASKSNVYVALLSVLVGLGTAIYMFTKRTKEATAAHEALSNVNKKADEEFSTQAATIDRLNGVLKSETASLEQKKKALGELQSIIPNYNAKLDEEGKLINNNTEAIKEYLVQLEKQIRLKAAQEELEELYRNKRLQEKNVQTQQSNYDRVREQNPIGVVYGGDAGIEAQRHELNRISDAEKALKKANDELKNTQTQIAAIEKEIEQASISSDNAPKTTYKDDYEQARKDWEEAKKELQKIESDKDKFTSKQYEDAKKRVESTEKAYKKLGGLTGTALSKQQKEADKEKKSRQKLSDQLLALQEKNQQAEVNLMKEGTEKKLAQIDADYSAQKAAIDRQQRELAEANKEAGITSTNASGLTSEQQVEIDRANELAFESRKKQIEEVYRAETDAMRAYISEYGTFQQQKLAIAEDYAERIRKAQTEGERLTLGRERDAALQQVDINALRQNIDWGSVFGEFGTMFREQLQPTIDRLKAIAGSDTFRQSSLEDQQLLYDLIARLEESNTVWDSDIFRRVSDDMNAYQSTMQGYIDAQERERIATDALAKAKANLVEAERRGGDVESAQQKVDLAASYLASVSDEVQAFGAQVKQTTSDLQSSAQQAVGMFQSLESGLQGLTSGSLKGIGQGIMQLDSLFEGDLTKQAGNVLAEGFQSLLGKDSKAAQVLTKALGDTGMAGEIISAVLGMLDLIAKEGLSGIVTSLQDTVFGAVNSLLDDVLNFRIVRDSAKNLMEHMGNILDTVTFGGFSKLTSIGSNAKETAEKIADLTASNDALRTSIDGLKDEIEGTNGTKSINAYNEAIEAQKKYEENLRQILDAQMRYTGSHHSNAYYWNLDASSIRQVNALLGTSLGNTWDDFSRLTADQMNQIRTHLPEVWSEMINEGKYGDRFKEDWENYADQAGEVVEMTDQLRESLAQISFDNMRDSFVDSLMDMDAEAADFANDFSQYMMRSLLNFSIGDQLDEQLKGWYESWTDTMNRQSGKLTEEQIDDYRRQWEAFVQEGLDIRDQLSDLTGYKGESSAREQQSTSRGFGTEMTHDDAGELSGRFTAVAESNYRIEEAANRQTTAITELKGEVLAITATMQSTYDVADEIRSILANSYLELQEINENTGNTAKYLKDIKADIAIVKQNTSRI